MTISVNPEYRPAYDYVIDYNNKEERGKNYKKY